MRATEGLVLDRAPVPALGEVLDFMALIWEVEHALQRTSRRMETTIGVTGPQRLVIRIVGKFPGIPAGHLAELLHVHPSTLTGVLRRLERQGMIRRRPDPRDGRRLLLGLTAAGRLLDVERQGTVEAAIRLILERTPQEILQSTRKVLTAIAETLDSVGSGTETHGAKAHKTGRRRAGLNDA